MQPTCVLNPPSPRANPMESERQDGATEWQAWVLILGVAEFFLFLFVFSTTWDQSRMISDNLLHPEMAYYTYGMTVFVVFQSVVCLSYIDRFRKKDLAVCVAGWGFSLISLSGWLVLAFNSDAVTHFSGVGLYISGLGGAYLVILYLAVRFDKKLEDAAYYITTTVLLLSTAAFLVAFLALYFTDDPSAWLWENLAFLCYLLFYLYFFANHPHEPFAPIQNEKPYTDVPLCRPLLVIKRS